MGGEMSTYSKTDLLEISEEDPSKQEGGTVASIRSRVVGALCCRCAGKTALKGLIALFMITTIIFAALYGVNKNSKDGGLEVCTSKDCIIQASKMALQMNPAVDPCQDFVEYACGGFIKNALIPDGEGIYDVGMQIDQKNDEILKEIVQEKHKKGDFGYVTKMKQFYESCMDEDQIDKIGLKPFLESPLIKSWPTLNPDWKPTGSDLTSRLEAYAKEFVFPFIVFAVETDEKHSKRRMLNINQPKFVLDNENLNLPRNSSIPMAYQHYIEDVTVLLGADNVTAQQDAKELVDFHQQLVQIFTDREQETNLPGEHFNPSQLGEVTAEYGLKGVIDVYRVTQAFFSPIQKTIFSDRVVNVHDANYLKGLANILKQTDERVIMNHFGLAFSNARIYQLTRPLREVFNKLGRAIIGYDQPRPYWKRCLYDMEDSFGDGLAKRFVSRTFQDSSKKYVSDLVDHLLEAFSGMVTDNTWMEQATKMAAMEKIKTMKKQIGYPDAGYDDDDIERKYTNYMITPGQYYKTKTDLKRQAYLTITREADFPVDPNDWKDKPYTPDSLYDPSSNTITFMAAMLQAPIFSIGYPNSINYGALGSMIGHELTHGFDLVGGQFDAQGNLDNWWQAADLKILKDKMQCVADQYDHFRVEEIDMNVNGNLTEIEDAADIAGLREAYRAYKQFAASQKEELPLPGLGLTLDQQFFVAYADTLCSKDRPGDLRQQVINEEMPPNRFRILGPIFDNKDFGKVFKCPAGSPMNPVKKCQIW